MNVTINISVPNAEVSTANKRTPLEFAATAMKTDFDVPRDPEPDLSPLQGPLVAMFLFGCSRMSTDAAAGMLMSPDNKANLNLNAALFNFVGHPSEQAMNGIDVFNRFAVANPDVLPTLQAAQGVFARFKSFCQDPKVGAWSGACSLKYSQVADMAQIDWSGLHP